MCEREKERICDRKRKKERMEGNRMFYIYFHEFLREFDLKVNNNLRYLMTLPVSKSG